MNAIAVTIPVPVTDEGIAVWDRQERVYLVRRRSNANWHIVRPLTALDYRVRGEAADAAEGDLACTSCPAALTSKVCWALRHVQAFEEATRWDELPLGEAVPA